MLASLKRISITSHIMNCFSLGVAISSASSKIPPSSYQNAAICLTLLDRPPYGPRAPLPTSPSDNVESSGSTSITERSRAPTDSHSFDLRSYSETLGEESVFHRRTADTPRTPTTMTPVLFKNAFAVLIAALLITSTGLGQSLRAAIFPAGAARLNNGSQVTIGQPFVGSAADATGQVQLGLGFWSNWIIPLSPPSFLPVTQIGFDDLGRFRFRVEGETGRSYVVEISTDLEHWMPATYTDPFIGTGTFEFTDPEPSLTPTEHEVKFYRIRML